MAVAFQTIGAATTGSDSSAETAAPSGVVSGDLLVLFYAYRGTATITPTTPTGWTARESNNETTSTYSGIWSFTRIADGTGDDTPTITLSGSPSSGWFTVILRIDGHDGTTPYDTGANATGAASDDTIEIPIATVARDGSLAIAAMIKVGGGSPRNLVWPGSWAERLDYHTASTVRSDITIGTLSVDSGAMSSETVSNWNISSAAQEVPSLTLIIQPPSGGVANSYNYQRNQ